jgi:hypothetical protein
MSTDSSSADRGEPLDEPRTVCDASVVVTPCLERLARYQYDFVEDQPGTDVSALPASLCFRRMWRSADDPSVYSTDETPATDTDEGMRLTLMPDTDAVAEPHATS